jgi:hypothetical protein
MSNEKEKAAEKVTPRTPPATRTNGELSDSECEKASGGIVGPQDNPE